MLPHPHTRDHSVISRITYRKSSPLRLLIVERRSGSSHRDSLTRDPSQMLIWSILTPYLHRFRIWFRKMTHAVIKFKWIIHNLLISLPRVLRSKSRKIIAMQRGVRMRVSKKIRSRLILSLLFMKQSRIRSTLSPTETPSRCRPTLSPNSHLPQKPEWLLQIQTSKIKIIGSLYLTFVVWNTATFSLCAMGMDNGEKKCQPISRTNFLFSLRPNSNMLCKSMRKVWARIRN